MKKTVKMIGMACLLGAFAFVCSSCKKDNTNTVSIKVNLDAVQDNSSKGNKAYIDYGDNLKIKWSEGDQIVIYNLNQDYTQSVRNVFSLYNGAGTTQGDFSGYDVGNLNEGFGGYYGFYPASMVVDYPIGPGNSQTFEVPAVQHYHAGTVDSTSLVMAVCGDNIMTQGFTMKHIFGVANLKLLGTRKVEWISITDNEMFLSGKFTLDIPFANYRIFSSLVDLCADANAPWEQYRATLQGYLNTLNYSCDSTSASRTIKLICDEPVQLNYPNWTEFHIALRPGSLAKGFVVSVKYADQDHAIDYNKFNPNSGEFQYGAYPQCPRAFCVKPGVSADFNVNM